MKKVGFPERLKSLLVENKNSTMKDLADYIFRTRQTISAYCAGKATPDWESIVRIAKYFEVSTDYLLGVTDVRTADPNLKPAMALTGLTENTFRKLAYIKAYADKIDEESKSVFARKIIDTIEKLIDVEFSTYAPLLSNGNNEE